MKSALQHPVNILGNKLFRFRRFFYAIPILLMLINHSRLYYPYGEHFYDELTEISGLVIAFTGAFLRFWASGSSRRWVVKKRKAVRLQLPQTGVFSLWKNPYFLGDAVIVLGLSLSLTDPNLVLLSLALFSLFALPVHFAREQILFYRFGSAYEKYSQKTGLFIPHFSQWRAAKSKFRWGVAFRKEGRILAAICVLSFFIEQFRELKISGRFDDEPIWIFVILIFFLLFLIITILEDFSGEDVPSTPHWIDDD